MSSPGELAGVEQRPPDLEIQRVGFVHDHEQRRLPGAREHQVSQRWWAARCAKPNV